MKTIVEFLVLARVASFWLVIYGMWLAVTCRNSGNQLQSGNQS